MRYNAVLASVLIFGSAVFADEIDDLADKASSASPSSTATTTAIVKPSFTPVSIKDGFLEQFTTGWDSRWVPSKAKKETAPDVEEEWAYVGRWSVEEPYALKGIEGDKGLVVKDVAAHHAISAKFPKAVDNKGKTLVVQYEVKLQNGLECGGAYLKLLKDNKALHAEEFSNSSPYVIMFGPDKCGSTNKVHFIFKHKNPKSGEYEEKHLKSPPLARITKESTLYTLIVKPDQSFEIRIDGKEASKGSLLENFEPPVNPPKEIEDKDDKKPEDWVDEAMISDPDAKKPEDWDEDAPYEITDEKAEKPADWLDDEPEFIPDPEATKPEDWDDEEDGDWLAPTIANPKCAEAAGCGKWEKPKIPNPAYKGKWTAPLIDNPKYKGVWSPRKVPNPNYFEDKKPANFEPIGAIGFELWTMNKDILFDNIYVGHSVADAEKIQKESFDIKKKIEELESKANEPKPDEKVENARTFKSDPVNFVKDKITMFFAIVQRDPIAAFRLVPEVAGGLLALVATLLALLYGLVFTASAPVPAAKKKVAAPKKEKKATLAVKEDVDVSETSATEGESKPRTTRRTSKKA